MENKIIYKKVYKRVGKIDEVMEIEIDGKEIKGKEDYLSKMEIGFQMPYSCNGSMDAFLDFIRDLSWLSTKKISLIIYNCDNFLNEDITLRDEILQDFKEIILPYWEEDVLNDMVDGECKEFYVYLVQEIE